MICQPLAQRIEYWPIDKLVFYARNPRKNNAAVDRMCASIREFGFKIPVLARSDGTIVDGHLRIKAARKLRSWPGGDTTCIPVILCDEWTELETRIMPEGEPLVLQIEFVSSDGVVEDGPRFCVPGWREPPGNKP